MAMSSPMPSPTPCSEPPPLGDLGQLLPSTIPGGTDADSMGISAGRHRDPASAAAGFESHRSTSRWWRRRCGSPLIGNGSGQAFADRPRASTSRGVGEGDHHRRDGVHRPRRGHRRASGRGPRASAAIATSGTLVHSRSTPAAARSRISSGSSTVHTPTRAPAVRRQRIDPGGVGRTTRFDRQGSTQA